MVMVLLSNEIEGVDAEVRGLAGDLAGAEAMRAQAHRGSLEPRRVAHRGNLSSPAWPRGTEGDPSGLSDCAAGACDNRSRMTLTTKPNARPPAATWGLAAGKSVPWEYAPAPESTDHVTIRPEYGLFIGNQFVPSRPRKTFEVINPATEQLLARVARASTADVDRAVKAARAGYNDTWSRLPGSERAKYLYRIARIIQERSREFAVVETSELRQADQGEPRRRRAARRGPFLLLRRLGRQAGVRLPEPHSALAGRGRADHPLEFPTDDARLEDRPCARGR